MSSGKIHRKINLGVGFAISGVLLGFERPLFEVFPFLCGLIFSTLVFSPDSDLRPSSKSVVFKFLTYPYSFVFKHRGISHSLIFGTATRVLYGFLLIVSIVIVLKIFGILKL